MKNTIISAVAVLSFLIPVAAFADSSVSITLAGANPQTVYAGQPYIEPGYSALSSVDGDITSLVAASLVDMSVPGWTTRSYSVTDSTGADASAFRSINVLSGGGGLPYCAGAMSPGWNVSLPGGGCGASTTFEPYSSGLCTFGEFQGCMVPNEMVTNK